MIYNSKRIIFLVAFQRVVFILCNPELS